MKWDVRFCEACVVSEGEGTSSAMGRHWDHEMEECDVSGGEQAPAPTSTAEAAQDADAQK
jgi:hypothetical protein